MKRYSKELYSKEALLKAAYSFTDVWYIHLDSDKTAFSVQLYLKENYEAIDDNICYKKFENELIAQQTRYLISHKTKNLREMIVARALSSTMIGNIDDYENDFNESEQEVMKDWFDDKTKDNSQ